MGILMSSFAKTSSILLLAALLLAPAFASAQQWGAADVSVDLEEDVDAVSPQPAPAPGELAPENDIREAPSPQAASRARASDREIRQAIERQIQGDKNAIHIYQLVEEIIDEVIADVVDLNPRAIAPAAFRTMNLTPNLSAQFGEFVESTLISALATHSQIAIKRCIACASLRSRVDGDEWVVTRGLVHHDELQQEAERLGAVSFLDARLSFFPGANIVAMQVEFVRASDGAVLWTETYRSDASTAAILRTGDRVQSRHERVQELERRIDQRPYYGHQLFTGAGYIPYDSPRGGLSGATIGYRLYEKFGPDQRYLFGVGAEGFANFTDEGILGAFVGATFQMELLPPNLNLPSLRTGPTIGGFFAGTEGNSFTAEWGLDAILQFRLGAGLSLLYFLPVEFAGYDLGGFGFKARASFNW